MVQLAKKMTTPKANKKEIAKNKTPSKSPQAVVMKAKDKNTPKIKKMVQKHLVTPEPMETSTKTPINNKKKNKKSLQKMEIESQGEESASLPETPKNKKKSNKQSPPKIEVDSKQDVKTPATSPNKKRNKRSKKGNNKAENQQNEYVEVEKKEVKFEKEKLEVPAQTPNIKKNKKSRKVKTENKQNESVEVEIEKEILEAQTPNAKMNKKSKKVKSENKQKEAVEVEKKILEAPAQTPNAKKNKNSRKVKKDTENKQNESVTLPETTKSNKKLKKELENKQEQGEENVKDEGKKNPFTVFVRGLNYKLDKSEIVDYFSKYGAVTAYLPKNRINPDYKNAGYCFMQFKEKEHMLNAIKGKNVIAQRTLYLVESNAGNKRKREEDGLAPSVKRKAISSKQTVYISRLNPATTEETVKAHFSVYGEIERVTEFKRRGYGFITFIDSSVLEKVLADTHEIDNKKIICQRKFSPDNENVTKKNYNEIFVNLDSTINKEDFEEYFNGVGKVTSITLPTVKGDITKKNKGFAFVAFETEDKMNEVLKMQHEINGFKLEVREKQFEIKDTKMEHEILVRNIPRMCNRREFTRSFSKFGKIVKVTLPLLNVEDPSEGCKKYGYIAFASEESKEKALAESAVEVKGIPVLICIANKSAKTIMKAQKTELKKESNEVKKETDKAEEEGSETEEEASEAEEEAASEAEEVEEASEAEEEEASETEEEEASEAEEEEVSEAEEEEASETEEESDDVNEENEIDCD